MKSAEVRESTLRSISYGTLQLDASNEQKSLLSSTSNAHGRDKSKAAIGCESCEMHQDCKAIGRFFCVEWSRKWSAISGTAATAARPLGFITTPQSLTEVA